MDQLISDFRLGMFFWQVIMIAFWILLAIGVFKLYRLITKYLKLKIKELENTNND